MVFSTVTERNLILTGYTGPQQPALGRQLAERLGVPFVNIDMQIEERAGVTLDEIKATFGEARLKTLEADVVHEAALHRGAVIRVSGQTLMHGNNFERLAPTGPVICLVAQLDAVLRRLHLMLGARYHDPDERALALGHLKREWGVRGREGVHELDTTYLSHTETVQAAFELWQQVVTAETVQ